MINGFYDHYGYRIESDGHELYTAGNHCLESTTVVERNSPAALPIRTIKQFCRRTAKEIAQERREAFGGVECSDRQQ